MTNEKAVQVLKKALEGKTSWTTDKAIEAFTRQIQKNQRIRLGRVEVIFADSSFNYKTAVSSDATEVSCRAYFVGKPFTFGTDEKPVTHICTEIVFTRGGR